MQHTAEVIWERGDEPFIDSRYSRRHLLRFDGGAEIAGSSSVHVVPVPMSDASAVDPEECFISSLSSCHMLWFLSVAAQRKFRVDRYHDRARGMMEQDARGRWWVSRVELHPEVGFSGEAVPSRGEIEQMHHEAHEQCFIANSVRTDLVCKPVYGPEPSPR